MKTVINTLKAKEFSERFKTAKEATREIMRALGCSVSKAEKLQRGFYPSKLVYLETLALAKLWNCSAEEIYSENKATQESDIAC